MFQKKRLIHSIITLILFAFLIVLAFLSDHYNIEADVSANSNNTLSITSQKLLTRLDNPISITVYISPNLQISNVIKQLVHRYQVYKTDINLTFVDPEKDLEKVRELNIGTQGLIVIEYQGRHEKISFLNESNLTNALLQLASSQKRWVSFLSGHGERSPLGKANFDFGQFNSELKRRNIKPQLLNLAQTNAIPDNSALLVLSSPKVAWLAGEIKLIQNYIQQGGNLLLLTDPNDKYLSDIQKTLGIHQLIGSIVDTSSSLYGIDDPSFVLVGEYPVHPLTQGLQNMSLYPKASALTVTKDSDFNAVSILKTIAASWTETGEIKGAVRFDKNTQERQGPLNIGFALTRQRANKQQRIVVIGDGDFLSNTFLGNVGNLDVGLRVFNWLIHEDKFIDIPAKIATDKSLHLSYIEMMLIGFGFLIVLPLLLFITGFIIWRKRKGY